jgi:hypothetical protein
MHMLFIEPSTSLFQAFKFGPEKYVYYLGTMGGRFDIYEQASIPSSFYHLSY